MKNNNLKIPFSYGKNSTLFGKYLRETFYSLREFDPDYLPTDSPQKYLVKFLKCHIGSPSAWFRGELDDKKYPLTSYHIQRMIKKAWVLQKDLPSYLYLPEDLLNLATLAGRQFRQNLLNEGDFLNFVTENNGFIYEKNYPRITDRCNLDSIDLESVDITSKLLTKEIPHSSEDYHQTIILADAPGLNIINFVEQAVIKLARKNNKRNDFSNGFLYYFISCKNLDYDSIIKKIFFQVTGVIGRPEEFEYVKLLSRILNNKERLFIFYDIDSESLFKKLQNLLPPSNRHWFITKNPKIFYSSKDIPLMKGLFEIEKKSSVKKYYNSLVNHNCDSREINEYIEWLMNLVHGNPIFLKKAIYNASLVGFESTVNFLKHPTVKYAHYCLYEIDTYCKESLDLMRSFFGNSPVDNLVYMAYSGLWIIDEDLFTYFLNFKNGNIEDFIDLCDKFGLVKKKFGTKIIRYIML